MLVVILTVVLVTGCVDAGCYTHSVFVAGCVDAGCYTHSVCIVAGYRSMLVVLYSQCSCCRLC